MEDAACTILKFESSGKLLKSFGAGLLLFPHGIYVDRNGYVWITDGLGRGSKDHQVFKFSSDAGTSRAPAPLKASPRVTPSTSTAQRSAPSGCG